MVDESKECVQVRDQERQRQVHDLQEVADVPHVQEERDDAVREARPELLHEVVAVPDARPCPYGPVVRPVFRPVSDGRCARDPAG